MSATMSQPPELPELPNRLEKKVDLLLAMLVDEQLWGGRPFPDRSYEVLRELLGQMGFDLQVDSGVVNAIELLHKYGDGSYFLSRRYILDRLGTIVSQFEQLQVQLTSINQEVRESGGRTREAIISIEQRLSGIDVSQKKLLSGQETNDNLTKQLNQTIADMADRYAKLRIEYGELSSSVSGLQKLLNTVHETLTNVSKDLAQVKEKVR
jgi:hypothetical protein